MFHDLLANGTTKLMFCSTLLSSAEVIVILRPYVVILDESTSALPPELEMELYKLLKSYVRIIISVGHRHALRSLHDWILQIHGDGTGSWHISRSQDYKGIVYFVLRIAPLNP